MNWMLMRPYLRTGLSHEELVEIAKEVSSRYMISIREFEREIRLRGHEFGISGNEITEGPTLKTVVGGDEEEFILTVYSIRTVANDRALIQVYSKTKRHMISWTPTIDDKFEESLEANFRSFPLLTSQNIKDEIIRLSMLHLGLDRDS